ncbi:hypothetical protein RLIN73S_06248 [Rhodanobacter lindaniclasticus]
MQRPAGAVQRVAGRVRAAQRTVAGDLGRWRAASHAALARERKFHFPLLSDFEPKGEVARTYGVYDAEHGVAGRALFVIDGDGVIRWSYLSPMGVNPGAAGIINALEALPANNIQKTLDAPAAGARAAS